MSSIKEELDKILEYSENLNLLNITRKENLSNEESENLSNNCFNNEFEDESYNSVIEKLKERSNLIKELITFEDGDEKNNVK